MFGTRTGTHCTPKATHSRHFLATAPASEAGVNSSLTDRVLRVETTPFPHLKQLGWDSNLSWLGTRLHEYMGIPMASLVGFIERHGVYYISVHAK